MWTFVIWNAVYIWHILTFILSENMCPQECIPVGCVPPTAVAVFSGGGLPKCMLGYTPQPGPGHPPGCGLETSLGQTPQTPPPSVGLEIPPREQNHRHV